MQSEIITSNPQHPIVLGIFLNHIVAISVFFL